MKLSSSRAPSLSLSLSPSLSRCLSLSLSHSFFPQVMTTPAESPRPFFRFFLTCNRILHSKLSGAYLQDEDAEDYDDTSYSAFGDEAAECEAHSYPAGEEDDEPS